MQVPSEITFHNLPHSESIELSIERWIARLDLDQIVRCDVSLGRPDRPYREGRPLDVTVEVDVGEDEPLVSHTAHENAYVAIPAFVTSQLTEAFQIGFILFVPFLIIDMVVANILQAMGMFMLSPTIISLPFKLLLFVLIDGWVLLIKALVLGYA